MKQTFVLRSPDILGRVLSIITHLTIGEGKLWEIIIQEYREKRTLEQNAKWHSMVGDIANYYGYTPIEMKTIMKDQLGLFHDVETEKKTYRVYHETSKMPVEDLSNLIEQTYQWAAENGIVLP